MKIEIGKEVVRLSREDLIKRRMMRRRKRKVRGLAALTLLVTASVLLFVAFHLIGGATEDIPVANQPTEKTAGAEPQQYEPVVQQQAQEPEKPETVATQKDFSNSVFIGDSMAEGFMLFSGIKDAAFYYERGLRLDAVAKERVADTPNGKTTILEALRQKTYDQVFLILGLNELGWDNADIFEQRYKNLVDLIRQAQPDAEIYLQAILPVTQERSLSDRVFNNADIAQYNDRIARVAEEKGVQYLDVSPVMTDGSGALYPEASTDGIHLNKEYCIKWLEYITEKI